MNCWDCPMGGSWHMIWRFFFEVGNLIRLLVIPLFYFSSFGFDSRYIQIFIGSLQRCSPVLARHVRGKVKWQCYEQHMKNWTTFEQVLVQHLITWPTPRFNHYRSRSHGCFSGQHVNTPRPWQKKSLIRNAPFSTCIPVITAICICSLGLCHEPEVFGNSSYKMWCGRSLLRSAAEQKSMLWKLGIVQEGSWRIKGLIVRSC